MRLPLTNLLLLAGKKYTVQLTLGANCTVAQPKKFLQASSFWKMNTNNSTNAATMTALDDFPLAFFITQLLLKN